MPPLVTTVIPTFRRPGTLRRALRSALAQTAAGIRILVLDDASGDETEAVVRAFNDPRIEYRVQAENVGYARNTALAVESVRTEYFSILADDDLLLPDFHTLAVEALSRHPAADYCFGTVLAVDANGSARPGCTLRYQEGYHEQPRAFQAAVRNGHANWVGTLFRTRVLETVGPLDPARKAIDFDFQLRCAALCNYVVIHAPVAVFTIHSGSISAGGDHARLRDLIWPSTRDSIEKIRQERRIPEPARRHACRVLRRGLARQLFDLAARSAAEGDTAAIAGIHSILRDDLGALDLAFALSLLCPLLRHRWLYEAARSVHHRVSGARHCQTLGCPLPGEPDSI